jgi:hypothetical protein
MVNNKVCPTCNGSGKISSAMHLGSADSRDGIEIYCDERVTHYTRYTENLSRVTCKECRLSLKAAKKAAEAGTDNDE